MPRTLPTPDLTTPDKSLVIGRPVQAKAALRDNETQRRLSAVVKEAARRTYAKQGLAAEVLGKDEGNFTRDVSAGRITLADLAGLKAIFLAQFGAGLVQEFGPSMKSAKEQARDRIPDIIREILDLTA